MPRRKRKQGERFEKGYIKNQILLIACQNFPKGIEEPDLRDTLRERFRIRESKGIKLHLADLEKKGLLSKVSQKGKANIWKIPTEPIFNKEFGYEITPTFATYAERFMFSEDRNKFVESNYARSILTDEHLNQLALGFWVDYGKQFVLIVDTFKKLEEEFGDPTRFNLSKRIKKSPTILSFLLFPEKMIVEMAEEFKEEVI